MLTCGTTNNRSVEGVRSEERRVGTFPICYQDISKAQETDTKLKQKLVSHKDYTLDIFRGGNKTIV